MARRARQKSARLSTYVDRCEQGADGESATSTALFRLGPLWTVWHDLHWPGRRFANIDHLVIGPGGIFVIDSKNWTGAVTAKGGVLRQNGYSREVAVAGCADSALAVGELLPRYADRVRPVLCFTRDEPVTGWARDALLCSTANVVPMLLTRIDVMGPDEIVDAVLTLQTRMRTVDTRPPTSDPRPVRRQPIRRPAAAPARSPRGAEQHVLGFLVRLVFIVLVVVLGLLFVQLVPGLLVGMVTPKT